MSTYMTEEEQLEAIKKWWQKYSTLILITISLVLLSITGYKYWYWHQEKIKQQASNTYEHLMLAFSNKDNKKIQSYANQLIKEHSNTVYADIAHLTLAKHFVASEKFNKAQEQLQVVASQSHMPPLQQTAKIRLARLFFAEKKYDEALEKLREISDSSFKPAINELKGDIHAAQGQYPQAVAAYRQAINESHVQGIGNLFLEMKTNELAAHTHSSTIAKTVEPIA